MTSCVTRCHLTLDEREASTRGLLLANGNVRTGEQQITRESFRCSSAKSPLTEAIPLSGTSYAATRTHARPARTDASPAGTPDFFKAM